VAAEQPAAGVRSQKERGLGEHLGLEPGGCEGGGLDDAGPGGRAAGGVDEVVGEAMLGAPEAGL
jgi:hypothetical protein